MKNGKMSIYDISEAVILLDELYEESIDPETGELNNADVLEKIEQEIEVLLVNKASDIIKFQKERDYFIANADAEIKKIQQLKKNAIAKQENFKNFIKHCMIKMGKTKIETPNGTLSLRKSKSVEILDEKAIPAKFTTVVQDIKISKTDIKKAIDSGEVVDGARVSENINLILK